MIRHVKAKITLAMFILSISAPHALGIVKKMLKIETIIREVRNLSNYHMAL